MSLDMVLYPFVASLTLDASSGNVVGGATGSVYAKADTTFTTPLAAVDASGNPVTLTSNANGVLPSFYVDGYTAVNWKSGEWVFPLVTSEPVEGPEGPAGVSVNGATATGDDLVFSLSNGATTPPVKLPTAPGGSDAGVASYITTPGTETATALSATFAPGYTVAPGADSGTRVQAAINALGASGGEITLEAGTHTWDVVPKLPHSLAGGLTIRGLNGATVALTSAARRVFDLNKTADHQTFQHIRLRDLDVDAGNFGGRHHVLVGGFVDGGFIGRFNVADWRIENVTMRNILTDPTVNTNHRIGIYLSVNHTASNEATQSTVTDVLIADVRQYGGNAGILLGGVGVSAGVNVWSDRITLERCHFDGVTVPSSFYASSGFHLGGTGFGGRVVIRDCTSKNTGDNGIEVNAWDDALVDNCEVTDAGNLGYYAKNFHPARDVSIQRIVWRNCRTIVKNIVPTAASGQYGRGWMLPDQTTDNPFGEIRLEGCATHIANPGDFNTGGFGLLASKVGVRRIHLDMRIEIAGVNVINSTSIFPTIFYINPAGDCTLTGRVVVKIAGAKTNTGTTSIRVFNLFGPALKVNVDAEVDINVSGLAGGSVIIANIGELATALSGRIGILAKQVVGDPLPYGVFIRTGSAINKALHVEGDFSGFSAGGREVSISESTVRTLVHLRNIVWKSAPTMSEKAVGTSPFTYQNVSGYPEAVTVQANGATISSINHAYGAGQTLWNTGAIDGQFIIQNGDTIQVNFTTGTPVVRARPAAPRMV